MTELRLTLACGDYDINAGLATGEITLSGVDLTVMTYPSPERHWRMVRHAEFDICELSFATYLVAFGRGDPPLIAIPAFPHRRFRHGYIFVGAESGIREPKDLEGRRVGIRTWQTTAGLWARGILQDDHGVDLTTIDWVAQDVEDVPFDMPDRFRYSRVPDGETVTAMVARGDLDALIYPDVPDVARQPDGPIRRLFNDSKAAEIEHFGRTGLFPIMHTVVLGRSLAERHPWLARDMHAAFEASRALAFERMRDPRRVSLAWFDEALDEQQRILGPDPWSYDFERNRHAIETMIRWSHEQGMIPRRFAPEELFVPSTLEALPHYV
jgi:4,5-dihydroxyphthalate decarboxylase